MGGVENKFHSDKVGMGDEEVVLRSQQARRGGGKNVHGDRDMADVGNMGHGDGVGLDKDRVLHEHDHRGGESNPQGHKQTDMLHRQDKSRGKQTDLLHYLQGKQTDHLRNSHLADELSAFSCNYVGA